MNAYHEIGFCGIYYFGAFFHFRQFFILRFAVGKRNVGISCHNHLITVFFQIMTKHARNV